MQISPVCRNLGLNLILLPVVTKLISGGFIGYYSSKYMSNKYKPHESIVFKIINLYTIIIEKKYLHGLP